MAREINILNVPIASTLEGMHVLVDVASTGAPFRIPAPLFFEAASHAQDAAQEALDAAQGVGVAIAGVEAATSAAITATGEAKSAATQATLSGGTANTAASAANTAAINANTARESIQDDLANKQQKLVSGENIKTINNESLLGPGNIVIEGMVEPGPPGTTPHIGENGNWWIGTQDTEVHAEGVTPVIGENGHWFIGDSDTGVRAEGRDGADATMIPVVVSGNTHMLLSKQSVIRETQAAITIIINATGFTDGSDASFVQLGAYTPTFSATGLTIQYISGWTAVTPVAGKRVIYAFYRAGTNLFITRALTSTTQS